MAGNIESNREPQLLTVFDLDHEAQENMQMNLW